MFARIAAFLFVMFLLAALIGPPDKPRHGSDE